jgi:riboflavin kinase/FMN adenylyltransferase
VVSGDRRGREIGVPTANLDHVDRVLPADGIYAGSAVGPDGRRYPAAISVGTKPTFGDHPRTCEVHLVGYDGPLDDYGWSLRVRIDSWMRDQIRYDGVQRLTRQLQRDISRARELCPLSKD